MTTHPLLVDAAWLTEHINDENVRVLDATAERGHPDGSGRPVPSLGPALYARAHIPGAVHADLDRDLADPDAAVPFMALDSETFAERLGALGVGPDSHVVIYDQGGNIWSSRLWWNLHLEGFDSVSILDGGLPAWQLAGQPTRPGVESYPVATFKASRRHELYADKETVLRAIDDDGVLLVNSLDPATFRGETDTYGRPGRIPGSVNLPYPDLIDATGLLRPLDEVRADYEKIGALDSGKKVITYCGGGLAASLLAFELAILGRDDVAVYDASMYEWGADESLPLEVD